eukprot:12898979-Prorocentrum_lima.AAC.1
MKRVGLLGPGETDDAEVRILNRILRYNRAEDMIEWECDPRHAQITIQAMGLRSSSNGLSTPG